MVDHDETKSNAFPEIIEEENKTAFGRVRQMIEKRKQAAEHERRLADADSSSEKN